MSKKIEFISEVKQDGETFKIQFKSPVEVSKMDDYDVYEFKEPKNNVANRIEVSEEKVNIFAGPSSINLDIKKDVAIEYQTEHGTLLLTSKMSKIENSDNQNVSFSYSLLNKDMLIGEYTITLKIT